MSTAFFRLYDGAFADLFFRNLLDSKDAFRPVHEYKSGYPIDMYFEGLDDEETETALVMEFAVPGVNPDEVKVSWTRDGTLRVKYDRSENEFKGRTYASRAISRRSFDLSWKIPRKLDISKLTAEFDKGLLTIRIPQSIDAIAEPVEVKVISA